MTARYVVTVRGQGIVFEGYTLARAAYWFETFCQEPRNSVSLSDIVTGQRIAVRPGEESCS